MATLKCSILLVVLNIFESGNDSEITGDVEAMHALGVIDVESLESYLKAKFLFEYFDEDSLKNLFDSLLVLFSNDDLLPVPVDAEIGYDHENTMSVGLSVYVDVFDYRQADLTFWKHTVKLPEIKTVGHVVNVLQSISDEAFKISELLTAGSEFKISLCQEVKQNVGG
ncbi:MAG: hypothetical protein M1130_01795 [Actinobacteria bacterium]|nr:hypothetical protein [Actinomycetota bacterium]